MKILFCIPAYGSVVRSETMMAVTTGIMHMTAHIPGVSVRVFTIDMAEISRVRNIFASMTLEGDYDALIMLDSDMGVSPDTFTRLVLSGHAVCGLTYPKRTIDLPRFHALAKAGESYERCLTGALTFIAAGMFVHNNGQIDVREGFLETRGLPGGCILIRKEMLEAMWEKLPKIRQTGNISDMEAELGLSRIIRCFDNIQDGDNKLSEDLSFCQRVLDVGGKIMVFIDGVVAHYGGMKFEGKYGDLLLAAAQPVDVRG